MEQLIQSISTAAHVSLAGIFALMPGTLFWLLVLGTSLAVRHFARRYLYQR